MDTVDNLKALCRNVSFEVAESWEMEMGKGRRSSGVELAISVKREPVSSKLCSNTSSLGVHRTCMLKT